MKEVSSRNCAATSVADTPAVSGVENAMQLQDTADSLANEITQLTSRLVLHPGDISVRAEYDQKVAALEMVTRTIDNLKRLPRYQGFFAAVAKPPKVVSGVVPRGLPYFQWTDEISDPDAPVFTDVVACLVRFQDVMFSYGLDFNANFLRLVPPCLSTSQRVWYDQFLSGYDVFTSPPTWSDFKESITTRYGRAVNEARAAAAWELVNVVMNKGESLDNFIDRFKSLRRRAVDQVPPSSILIQQYLRALPDGLHDKVVVAMTTAENDSHKKADVDAVILLSRKLHNAFGKGKNAGSSSAEKKHFDQSTSSTMKSKYAVIGVAPGARSHDVKKVQKLSGGSSRGEKWCPIHG